MGARYSYLDLSADGVTGGRLSSVTVGLNWYLNPNAKFQWNYDYTYRDQASNPDTRGAIHALGVRMAYDF